MRKHSVVVVVVVVVVVIVVGSGRDALIILPPKVERAEKISAMRAVALLLVLKVTISRAQTTSDVEFMKSSPLGCFSRGGGTTLPR